MTDSSGEPARRRTSGSEEPFQVLDDGERIVVVVEQVPPLVVLRGSAEPEGVILQSIPFNEQEGAHLVAASPEAVSAIELPQLMVSPELTGQFDYLHLFTTSQAGMDEAFPGFKQHLAGSGMLWVSWPKGRKLGTDLTLPSVIRIGYSHGLVESICLSVDDTWSALKFTHPKPGKTYKNSHGALPTT